MDLTVHYLTKNDCYKTAKKMTPKGIVLHSTGANNPKLSRYVAPDDGRLGANKYGNDWNRPGTSKCVHAMIGKDKHGKVCTYQTLPLNICCWGVGKGSKGSYNYNPARLQVEMLEDGLTDRTYFNAVYKEAQELCASWCKQFNLPASSISSHREAHLAGYGSNHGDPEHWFKKHGKTMDDFRAGVQNLLNKKGTLYKVQVGSFSKRENAEKQLAKAKAAGFKDAYITT